MARALDAELDERISEAIARGVCSAAAVAVGDAGVEIVRFGRGRTRRVPDDGEPCGDDAIYDLASLTKPIATAAIAMKLVARRALALDDPARRWFGGLTEGEITVAHLLGHASGLPGHVALYERILAGERAGAASPYGALLAMAAAQPLEARPGARAVYSDLGYALAGAVVEAAGGATLDALFAREIALPLGLDARFVDLAAPRVAWDAPVVATEVDARGLVCGEVHDENAHAAGGVCGHAGLFGTVADVSRFARALAHAAHGDASVFAPGVVRTFLDTAAAPDASWRLGWDTPSDTPGASHAGDLWPRVAAVGHLGFTGTSLWLDLPRRRWVALLTNRVHPRRDRPEALAIKDLRRAIGDAVVRGLG